MAPWEMGVALAACGLVLGLLLCRSNNSGSKRVVVLVLGDVGRSPRMQYHALSLADTFGVDLVGYPGAECHAAVKNHPNITVTHLRPWTLRRAIVLLPFKVLWQVVGLMLTLLALPAPHAILVQNPPAIPTLAVAHVFAVLRGCKLIIDWHNFGYTLLGLNLGDTHPLVRVSFWYEKLFGRGACSNLCVTDAMRKHLRDEWSVTASVLYDRPPAMFRSLSVAERHAFFRELENDGFLQGSHDWWGEGLQEKKDGAKETTLFTEFDGRQCRLREDRPAIVVSSTSWTADEDFQVLLDAVVGVEQAVASQRSRRSGKYPKVLFVITGKGPMKSFYEAKIASLNLQHTRVVTAWLKAADYPRLLGSADLGVSLHLSSSGLDLPMKVVDMFGCALPVCAIGFKCLPELVQHRENSLVFKDSAQLTEQILRLFKGFGEEESSNDSRRRNSELAGYRAQLEAHFKAKEQRWDASWKRAALPLFQ